MKKKKRGKGRKQRLSEEPMTLRPIVRRDNTSVFGFLSGWDYELIDYNYDPPRATRHKWERR